MRQLVDQAHLGLAADNGVDVHLLHGRAAILHLPPGNHLEILELRLGVAAAVGLHEADHHVEAAGPEPVSLLQHLVGLAHTGSGADVDAQPRAILLFDPRQQGVSSRSWSRHGIRLDSFPDPILRIEGEVELEHVHPRLAKEAPLSRRGVASTRRLTSASGIPRSRATRGT